MIDRSSSAARHRTASPDAPAFHVAQSSLRALDAARWDDFAQRCEATYEASHEHLRRRQLGQLRHSKTMALIVSNGAGERVAQCSVLRNSAHTSFQYGLHLLPEMEGDWPDIMAAILRELGSGHYCYGGGWSVEPRRQTAFRGLPGVTVLSAMDQVMQAVDFTRWPNWDAYWRKVSDSVRYEARVSKERIPGLRLEHYHRRAMLRAIPPLVETRSASYVNKQIGFSRTAMIARYISHILMCPDLFEAVVARSDQGVEATYFGANFGANTYYLDGGLAQRRGGANWHLLHAMVHAAYERSATGKFLMGKVDYSIHDEATGGGLIRARKALRTTDYPIDEVTFDYRP